MIGRRCTAVHCRCAGLVYDLRDDGSGNAMDGQFASGRLEPFLEED